MVHQKENENMLLEQLKDDTQADAYFFDIVEQCKKLDKKPAQELLVVALKNITKAQGGMGNVLDAVGIKSDGFYKIVSTVILRFVK